VRCSCRSSSLEALDFWPKQPLVGDGTVAEMSGDDLGNRRPVDKVVEDWPGIDVQRGAIVTAVATGRGQHLYPVREPRLSQRPLQNRHQGPAAALGAVRSKAEVDPILTTGRPSRACLVIPPQHQLQQEPPTRWRRESSGNHPRRFRADCPERRGSNWPRATWRHRPFDERSAPPGWHPRPA
jgi:hypothetical protein